MAAFRAYLVFLILVVLAYTAVVMAAHGPNLFPQFFGDIARMGWAGQFNLDFLFLLSLSGLWVAWRHEFSGPGLLLGIGAFFLGAPYLGAYLLVAIAGANGDMKTVLLGPARA